MRRMKKYGILAMIAMVLVITMSVPKVLAAAVPDAAGKASEGASVTSEQTAEQPPEKEAEGEEDAGEAKEPAGTENVGEAKEAKDPAETEKAGEAKEPVGTENAGEAKEPAGTENPEGLEEKNEAVEASAEDGRVETEQAAQGDTAAQGATINPEKAAEVEPLTAEEKEETATEEEKVSATAKGESEEEEPEPDWLAGGTGSMEDLTSSHKLKITEQYIQRYENYDLGKTTNCTFDAMLDDKESIQGFVCLSPGKTGYGLAGNYMDHLYEYTTPMLAKVFYYGVGPGSDVLDHIIEEVRGNRDGIEEIRLIITHVAASQVYAKLHDADASMGTTKTAYNSGFNRTKPQVRQMANRFGNEIEGLSVPKSYHVYVTVVDDDRKQDAAYGFFNKSIPEEAQVKLKKSAADTQIISGNSLYTLEGAEYGVYTDQDCSEEVGKLVTDQNGDTPSLTLTAGKTYYVKEKSAPRGYRRDDKVHSVTLAQSDKVYTVDVSDAPVYASVPVRIEKRSKLEDVEKAGSLAGTEFTISYYDGYYGAEDLPDKAAGTWVIRTADTPKGCEAQLREEDLVSGTLYKDGEHTVLPLGTITIQETKAVEGYYKDAEFGVGIEMYIGQVRQNEQTGEAEIVSIQGEPASNDAEGLTFAVQDTPIPEPPVPEIGTYLSDAEDDDKTIAASGKVTVIDNVRFKNFTKGSHYRFEGMLMAKESGEAAVSGGEVIKGEATLIAESADGSADVVFTFDAADLQKGDYVAFEEVYEIDEETGEEHLVAVHKDLQDEAQTITRPKEPEKERKPKKPGKPSGSPRTGDSSDLYGIAACIALCAAGMAAAVILKKRKAD